MTNNTKFNRNSKRTVQGKDGQVAKILGIRVFGIPRDQLLRGLVEKIEKKGNQDGASLVFTPNPEMLVEASKDEVFKEILNRADINIPDGVGIVWAARLMDQNISRVVPGADLAHDLVMLGAERGWRVYLMGGRPNVAKQAGQMLEIEAKEASLEVSKKFVIMADEGPADVSNLSEAENQRLVAKINKFEPHLLLVGFGHKKQESWLVANRERLRVGVAMGVGGSFDYWSGRVKRAPGWLRKLGLEWLFRLFQEPWRWRRQLRLIEFGYLVIWEKIKKRGTSN